MLTIGEKLKTLRKENNFTAKYICDKLHTKNYDYSEWSIYKWEENKSEPDIYVLVELAKILKASLSSILNTENFEVHNLTSKEMRLLDIFRNDENFMKLAMLMLKHIKE